jgi:REP element-mobilizing transposase RayT
MRYRSTHKTVYSAKYHLIWCPNTAAGCSSVASMCG